MKYMSALMNVSSNGGLPCDLNLDEGEGGLFKETQRASNVFELMFYFQGGLVTEFPKGGHGGPPLQLFRL